MAAAKCIDPCTSGLNSLPVENFVFNYKTIKPLDDALRCSICFEYYSNCMMTKCSHNYCSVCIRRYMTYKSQCPTCFQDASEPELRNNRLVDEILRLYKKLRGLDDGNSAYPLNVSDAPVRILVREKDSSSQSTSTMCTQSSSSNQPSTPRVKIEIPDEIESMQDKVNVHVKIEPDFDEVTCPVCYNTVLADRINSHLDSCLKQQFNEEPDERKTLPKLVYHLLTEKEIKIKLKEHGLSVSGNRQALIRRHKNFITLYNANCDSLSPKPVSEIVNELELQEVEERINSLPKQIQVHKKSDQSLIEQQHQSYVNRHHSQFNALINDVHRRQIAQMHIKQEKEDSYIENYEHQTNRIILDQGNIVSEDSDVEERLVSGDRLCKGNIADDSDSTSSEDLDIRTAYTKAESCNEIWICPVCSNPDDGNPMIGCDECDDWYHWVCVNIDVPPRDEENWYCERCVKKRKAKPKDKRIGKKHKKVKLSYFCTLGLNQRDRFSFGNYRNGMFLLFVMHLLLPDLKYSEFLKYRLA